MSIDVASLVFEIDSTQAVTARKNLEDLENVGAQVDASARRIKTATEQAGIGLDKVAAGAQRATKAATEHATSQGAVERATRQAELAATRAADREAAAWAKVEAALEKRNAAYRGELAAQSATQAAKAAAQEAAAWGKVESALEKRNAAFRVDMAAKQALEAAKAANDEALAWAKVEAALAGRNAELRASNLIATMKAEAAAVGALESRIDRLMASIDPARAAQSRLNAEMQEATALYKAGAISASDYARAVSVLDAKMAEAARQQNTVNGLHGATAKGAKLAGHEMANLGSQFADIGVSLASGQALWLVAIQQGAQIGGIYGQAAGRGVTLTNVLGQLGGAAGGVVSKFGPLLLVTAAIGGAFAIATQQINEGNKDIAKGLGLTAEQMEKVKNDSVTMGDTIKATFQVAGQAIWDAFGPQIEQVGRAIKTWYDQLIDDTVKEIKAIVGFFVGGYEAIRATWGMLPAAIGDAVVSAANFAIRAVETMVNGAIDALNRLNPVLNTLAQMAGMPGTLAPLSHIDLPEIANANEGAMRNAGEAAAKAYADGFAKGGAAVDSTFSKIAAQAVKNAKERILKEAGDAKAGPKGAAAPRDQSQERTAQIEGMIQAALADELQARLGVTREVEARADLERQIARAQEAVKAAQLDRQAANIADDKGLTDAKKAELLAQVEIVRSINARAAAYREQAITEAAAEAKAREAFSILQADVELQIRILDGQDRVARFEYERQQIARDRLKLEQTLEREALEQLVASQTATDAQKEIAQAILDRLGGIHATEQDALRLEALGRATDEAARAIEDIGDAIREHDWGRVFTSLIKAVDQAIVAFTSAKTGAERMSATGSLFSAAGGAVGGKAGSVLGAVGSGFSAAGAAAGMAGSFGTIGTAIAGLAGPIGIAVAGFGLLSGILGDQKAKKRAKLEQEARDMENARAAALEEANRQAELQLRILELSGDEIGALTKRREAELATLKGASRALAEYVHALEDWVKAVDLAKDAVSKAQDDLRAAYEAEKDRLNAVIASVETARDRLRDAYQRERGAIEGTISSVRSLVETFADFRKELDMMAVANDPSRQYRYAQRQFASATNDNFVERGRAFAEASQSASATELDFQRDLAAVRRRTDEAAKTAQTQLTAAEKQLLALDNLMSPLLGANDNLLTIDEAIRGLLTAEQEAALAAEELVRLDAQVGALIAINSSVLSVVQAVNNLQGALGALAAAQASKPSEGASGQGSQAVGLTGYVDKNADLAALYASGSGMAAGRTKEQFAQYHWERYGQAEGRTYTAFARGGDHTGGLRLVGEEGPELEATGPSRIFSARQTAQMLGGDNSEVVAELRSLREEVAALRKEAAKTAGNTKSMDDRGKRQEFNGAYVRGQSPDDPVVVAVA
ncbi:phage tail length tape measure family protein [Phenylobacterium sp.]|uniref:phage tail length tape measure family protein n=1 Tax=Phenylobacterium sp. TaxID=1871053 RepID=UPI00273125C2|nr:phage tail length tape measure family protein [Phenylobacterium sp.]MDP1599023.1 phage tail length tape measure family protein [Phenylobacterium sp.]MDP3590451.1 phage tail length tape measure family protein [Phenylobacterium sp.]